MSRIALTFSRDLTEPGTFYLLADDRTIRANLREAESAPHVVEFEVRYEESRLGALHVRPLDSELCTWLVESAVFHKDLALLELQLSNVPLYIAAKFRRL